MNFRLRKMHLSQGLTSTVGITKKFLHTKDVLPREETFVIIDSAQRGLGGDNSWGEPPHQEYRLFDGNYELSYILSLKDTSSVVNH